MTGTTILDLPDEIRLLIGEQLSSKSLYALIRVCRSFNSSFIPCLWSDLIITQFGSSAVPAEVLRTNAHRIKTITSSILTQEYYAITFPRLHTLRMVNNHDYVYGNISGNLQVVLPQVKIEFLRRHPNITALTYQHLEMDYLTKEFWDVIGTELVQLDELEFTGVVDDDAVDSFWRACGRVQTLHLKDVDIFSEIVPTLSTLSIPRLRDLTIDKYSWQHGLPRRLWSVLLLKRVKDSEHLRRIEWSVGDVVFPAQIVLDAFAEGCWPDLCELIIGGVDQNVAAILRGMASRRLTYLELWSGRFGPLTYNCLKEKCFKHLRNLSIEQVPGATSAMVQEILTECMHLVRLDVPYIFVRDIATASKPWVCLGLEMLVVYIAKRADDGAGWDGRVIEQIATLKRLEILDLQRNPYGPSYSGDKGRPLEILALRTVDLHIPNNSSGSTDDIVTTTDGSIRRWSSLVQLEEFSFDGDRQWMGVKELEWMIEHWKDLKYISGDFRAAAAGSGDGEIVKRLLDQHDIAHYRDTHGEE